MRILSVIFLFCIPLFASAQSRKTLDSLTNVLQQVYNDDQLPRYHLDSLHSQYGENSPEVLSYWKVVNLKDSINQQKVIPIINRYGWLSADQTSVNANSALFLIIQHANVKVQTKYLPALEKAIHQGKANPISYAYLSDRIKMFTDHYQTYGTQIGGDYKGNYCFWPIEDEPHVNARRKLMGLDSIQQYAKNFNIKYKATVLDSLKDNVIINCFVADANNHNLDFVKVYLASKLIAITNIDGFFRVIIPASKLNSSLLFIKKGYKSTSLIEKTGHDVYYSNATLEKL